MPSAVLVLAGLKAGVPVYRIILDTGCNRRAVMQLARSHGLVINPVTDVAKARPSDEDHREPPTTAARIRRWGKVNGWPLVAQYGVLPKALVEAYRAAHDD